MQHAGLFISAKLTISPESLAFDVLEKVKAK
jgi:hypothetical protein